MKPAKRNLAKKTRKAPPTRLRRAFLESLEERSMLAIDLVSASVSGVISNGLVENVSVSGDGRWVAFDSTATNLTPADTNSIYDVFLKDMDTGTVTLVSTSSAGVQGNSHSSDPYISANGRYVAFTSGATNLVTGDTNGRNDVFVKDMQTGTTTRISLDSSGGQLIGHSLYPTISASGEHISFVTDANGVVAGDTNNSYDVYVRNTIFNTVTRASSDAVGVVGNGISDWGVVSESGLRVVFQSTSTDLTTDSNGGSRDIFVKDLVTGAVELVSKSTAGVQANSSSQFPVISSDESMIAFESYANNLVSDDTNGVRDVFVTNRLTGDLIRVSESNTGEAGNQDSTGASISSNGSFVAFVSTSTNLTSAGGNGQPKIFVKNVAQGTVALFAGPFANGAPQQPLVGSSRYLTFISYASNLVANDTNNERDAFRVKFNTEPTLINPFSTETVDEDQVLHFDALANANDLDGDVLEVSIAVNPSNGTLVVNPDGTIDYTPDPDFFGTDSFEYSVDDAFGGVVGQVEITVNPVNDIPTADDQSLSTLEDVDLSITLTGNDLEDDGNLTPLTFTITVPPTHGTLSGSAPDLIYTPNLNDNQGDSFQFEVSDSEGGVAIGTVSIAVDPVNDPPEPEAHHVIIVQEDVPFAFTLLGTDVEDDAASLPLTFAITTPPPFGTLTGTVPNLFYTTNPNDLTMTVFEYSVTDSNGAVTLGTIAIAVVPVNDAPTANAATYQGLVSVAVPVTLTGADIESDPLTFVITQNPANGTLSGTSPNLTYTPNSGFQGEDSFYYKVNDGAADSFEALITIQVTGAPPTLDFSTATQTVSEGDGTIAAQGTLTAALPFDLFVPVFITGTATSGVDFAIPNSGLFFPAGSTTGSLTIELLDDNRFEGIIPETIIATLQAVPQITLGTSLEHTISISDNDAAPTVSFAGRTQSRREGETALLTVVLSGETDLDVTVPFTVSGAADGADYSTIPGSVTLLAGQRTADVSFSITDDTLGEPSELIQLDLGTPTNASLASGDAVLAHTVFIPGNDAPIIRFASTGTKIDEANATVPVTVSLSNLASEDVDVFFTVQGTARSIFANPDHDLVNGHVIIRANQLTATIYVPINEDTEDEPTETIVISLGIPTDGKQLGTTRSHTIQITDDDKPIIQFVGTSQAVWEDEGTVTISVRRTIDSISTISVPVTVSGTGAPSSGIAKRGADTNFAAGEDFFFLTTNFVFTPGGPDVITRTVTINNDNKNEPSQKVIISLGEPSGEAVLNTERDTYTVKILDDDPLITLTSSKDKYDEDTSATPKFTVSLSAPSNKAISIPYKRIGNATYGSDYTLNDATPIVIPAGAESKVVGADIINDSLDEFTEDFGIQLKTPSSGVLSTGSGGVTIDITDNDSAPTVEFESRTTFSKGEGKWSVYVGVELNKASGRDIDIDFDFSGSAARYSSTFVSRDYSVYMDFNDHLTIPAGFKTGGFYVNVYEDSRYESDESIVVTMDASDSSNVKFPANNKRSKTIVIKNDDVKPVPPPQKQLVCYEPSLPADYYTNSPPGTLPFGTTGVEECYYADVQPSSTSSGGVSVSSSAPTVAAGSISLSRGQGGPLEGATAFFDANFNGVIDFLDLNGDGIQTENEPDEPFTPTEIDGGFAILIDEEFDQNADGIIDTSEGRWVISGGVDTSTGLAWTTRMYASVGNFALTPLTTVAESLVRLQGFTTTDANTRVTEAFGLPAIDLAGLNPLEEIKSGNSDAAKAYATHVQIFSTVIQIAEFWHGTQPTFGVDFFADLAYDDMGEKIAAAGSTLDLTQPEVIAEIFNGISVTTGFPPPSQEIVDGAVAVITAGNQAIQNIPFTSDLAYAEAVIKVKKVMQGQAGPALGQAAAGTTAIADVIGNYTGPNLVAALAAAQVEVLDPPNLFVTNSEVVEGNNGARTVNFTVELIGDHTKTVTVDYVTEDDDALAGSDYEAATGTLTWLAGDVTPRTVSIVVTGDEVFETDEYFLLRLTNNHNGVLRRDAAYGRIRNDDALSFQGSTTSSNDIEFRLNVARADLYANNTIISTGLHADPITTVLQGQDNVDDTFRLNFSTNSFRADTITFNGGGGTGYDTAIVVGGEFATIRQSLLNATDGHTTFTPLEWPNEVNFAWTGLEPVLLNVGSVAEMIFEIPAGATAILEDADPTDADPDLVGKMRLYSPTSSFEETIFTNPTTSIVIFKGANVTFTVASIDPSFAGTITESILNQAPTDITLDVDQFAENTAQVDIGTLTAVDPDTLETATFTLVPGANDNDIFRITDGKLQTNQLFNYETRFAFTILVKVTDSADNTFEKQFAINVTNVAPTTPTDTNSAADSIPEVTANGTPVGITAAATDVNGPAVVYTLTENAGGRFAIDGSTGIVTVANSALLDYETDTSHSITVQANDGAGGESTQSFTIAVTDVAELDFGDAPNSYGTTLAANGAQHLTGALFLGASVDTETDGQPSANADGDGADENGVVLPATLYARVGAQISVTASMAGRLDAWIDFNRNGVFDATEQIANGLNMAAGANSFTITLPTTVVAGPTFARFRISCDGWAGSDRPCRYRRSGRLSADAGGARSWDRFKSLTIRRIRAKACCSFEGRITFYETICSAADVRSSPAK
jgi:hypothetical protein